MKNHLPGEINNLATSELISPFDSQKLPVSHDVNLQVIEKTRIEKRWLKGKTEYTSWIVNAFFLQELNEKLKNLKLSINSRNEREVKEEISDLELKVENIKRLRDKNLTADLDCSDILASSYLIKEAADNKKELIMQKHGKTWGGQKFRSVIVQWGKVLITLKQLNKNGHEKDFETPTSAMLESRKNMSNSDLGWTDRKVKEKSHRVVMKFQDRKKPTAIYFDTEEEAIKLRDYTIIQRITGEKTIKPTNLFKDLSVLFKLKNASTFKDLLIKYTEKKRNSIKNDRLSFLKNSPLCTNINRIQLKTFVDSWLKHANSQYEIYLKIETDPSLLQIAIIYTTQELERISKIQPMNYRALARSIPEEYRDVATSDPEKFCDSMKKNKEKFLKVIYNAPPIFKIAAASLALAPEEPKKPPPDGDDLVEKKLQMERRNKLIELLQRSLVLQRLNSSYLVNFVNAWKSASYEIMHKTEIKNKSQVLEISFFEIEIDQRINILKPALILSLVKTVEDATTRRVNDDLVHARTSKYFSSQLSARIQKRLSDNILIWRLYNENDSNLSNVFSIMISDYDKSDQLYIELFDQGGFTDDSKIAKTTIALSDLHDVNQKGKNLWLCLDYNNRFSDTNNIESPFLHVSTFHKPLPPPHNNLLSYEEFLDFQLEHRSPIFDPVYDDPIKLPEFTPKNFGFITRLLEERQMSSTNFRYQLVDKFITEEDTLKKLRKTLYKAYIKESCKNSANIRKSLLLLVDLEDEIVKRQIIEMEKQELKNAGGSGSNQASVGPEGLGGNPNQNLNSGGNIIHQHSQQDLAMNMMISGRQSNFIEQSHEEVHPKEENDRAFSNLQGLLSNRKKWKEGLGEVESKLFSLCSKGIPNYLRSELWTGLGHKEDIMRKTSRTFIQHVKMNAYNRRITELDIGDREYYQKTYALLLFHSKRDYTLLNQELQDDILSQIHIDSTIYSNHIDKNFLTHLQNILMAYNYWSGVMASTITKNVENFSVNYSLPILKICEKLLSLFNSNIHFSDEHHSPNYDYSHGHDDRSPIDHEKALSEKKEEDVFWMLVCITSFVLRRYYLFKNLNMEEHSNATTTINLEDPIGIMNYLKAGDMKPPLQSCYLSGLKGDLLLLKMSIKSSLPDIHNKICELGLPLEYYFGDCFLNIFVNFFNNELLFRVWDMLFYEASLEAESQIHLTIISVICTTLRLGKGHLLKAKSGKEFMFTLRLTAKFIFNINAFIDETYLFKKTIIANIQSQKEFWNQTEDNLYNFYENFIRQNITILRFVNSIKPFDQTEGLKLSQVVSILDKIKEEDPFYAKLRLTKRKMQLDALEVAEEFDEEGERLTERKILNLSGVGNNLVRTPVRGVYKKLRLGFIHLFLHKITLFWAENAEIVMEISYGRAVKDRVKVSVDTMVFLNHYEQFPYAENENSITIKLFEITKEKENSQILENKSPNITKEEKKELRLIKKCSINIHNITSDALMKGIFLLEDIPDKDSMNYVTSEIEISIVISNENNTKTTNMMFLDFQDKPQTKSTPQSLSLQFLRNFYRTDLDDKIKQIGLEKNGQRFAYEIKNVLTLYHITNTSFSLKNDEWKKNSIIDYEQFRQILKKASDDSNHTKIDFGSLFNSMIQVNSEKNFYLADFLIELVFFTRSSFKQKCNLLFDILHFFQNSASKNETINLQSVKGFLGYAFELLMVFIPQSQIDNLVDQLLLETNNLILKAKLISNERKSGYLDLTEILNAVSNHTHLLFCAKDIYLGSPDDLFNLKNIIETVVDLKSEIEEVFASGDSAVLSIKYITGGMKHRFKCMIDRNFRVLKKIVMDSRSDIPFSRPNTHKPTENILHQNENIIPLTNHFVSVSKIEFISLMDRVPLLRYLLSLENTTTSSTKLSSNTIENLHIDFEIMVNHEVVANFIFTEETSRKKVTEKKISNAEKFKSNFEEEDFNTLAHKWNENYIKHKGVIDEASKYKRHTSEETYTPGYEIRNLLVHESVEKNLVRVQSKLIYEMMKLDIGSIKGVTAKLFMIDLKTATYDVFLEKNHSLEILKLSLYDIAQVMNNSEKFKIYINYEFKPGRPTVEALSSEQEYFNLIAFDHLALYRYADHSTDWLPCKVIKKYVSEEKKERESQKVKFYGVIFKKFPTIIFRKRMNEVLILKKFDLKELEEVYVGAKIISNNNILNENIEDMRENSAEILTKKPTKDDFKPTKEDERENYLKTAFKTDYQMDDHIFVSPGPSKKTRQNIYRDDPNESDHDMDI